MSQYAKIISEATGETNPARLEEIEDTMRVSHRTLDHLTRPEIMKEARLAVEVLTLSKKGTKSPKKQTKAQKTAIEIINGPLQLGAPLKKDDCDYQEVTDAEGNRSMLVYGDNATVALQRAKLIIGAVNYELRGM